MPVRRQQLGPHLLGREVFVLGHRLTQLGHGQEEEVEPGIGVETLGASTVVEGLEGSQTATVRTGSDKDSSTAW